MNSYFDSIATNYYQNEFNLSQANSQSNSNSPINRLNPILQQQQQQHQQQLNLQLNDSTDAYDIKYFLNGKF